MPVQPARSPVSRPAPPTVRLATCLAASLVACLALGFSARATGADTLRIGVGTRIATAPLHVAASRGYFEREGLEVALSPIADDELVEALAEEDVDLATTTADALLRAEVGGLELRGAYVLGLSGAADALVARAEVRDTRRLRGRRVAVAPGTAGELVLREALQRKGRRLEDVEPVALDGIAARDALLDGDVDAAVLHGPALAALERTTDGDGSGSGPSNGFRVLATAADPRGLVSDLLVGDESSLAATKTATKGVIRAIDRAIGWMRRHPDGSVALLSEVYAVEPEDVARALAGMTLFDVDENMTLLRGDFQKAFSSMSEVLDTGGDDRAREVPSANRYLALSALRQVAAGR